jgi:Putative peptidoglycan binding domain
MRHLLMGAAASAIVIGFAGLAVAQESGDLPPNAIPGHCYGKLLIPEVTETYTDQVIDQASRTEIKVIPAVYGTATQTVVASEAHVEYETIPAVYRTITEVVTIKPAVTHKITVPAIYGEVTEQILVREAHNEWRRGTRHPGDVVIPGSDKLLPTGEVICLIAIPAEYKTVTHTVVKVVEQVREVVEPAVTETITRKIVETPARVIEHQVPATYKTVSVTTIAQPERTETITIPATYRTVTKTRVVAASHFEWKVIDCKAEGGEPMHATEATTTTVTHHYYATGLAHGGDAETQALQEALQKRGYYDGPLTGRFTAATQWAMTRFQRDNHLARGSFDEATADALGIPAPSVGS